MVLLAKLALYTERGYNCKPRSLFNEVKKPFLVRNQVFQAKVSLRETFA